MDLNTEQGYIEAGRADHAEMLERSDEMVKALEQAAITTAYEQAIWAQSACNLSGLCHSLPKVADAVWAEVRAAGGGTDQFNSHPIMRLFAEQFMHLTSGCDWWAAMDIAEKKVAEGKGHEASHS